MIPKMVLVTGVAGFIGSNLAKRLLSEGYPVVGIDNFSAGTLENVPKGCDFRRADIRDKNLSEHFEGVDTVFHLAAKNCLADCAANPVETAEINVAGTVNVLEAAVKAGIYHFIYADTSAEYEGIDEFPSRVELVKPISVYACSKRGGSLMCEAFRHLHGFRVTQVRYFNVYGPAQDWRRVIPPVMSAFTIRLLSGAAPVIYGTGHKRRDFIHVDDVNDFHLKLLRESEIQGGVYNVGSGKDWSILEVFDLVERVIRSGLRPIFKDDLPAEAPRTLADISQTLRTGWRPKIPLEQGIKSFIEYTRERLRVDSA